MKAFFLFLVSFMALPSLAMKSQIKMERPKAVFIKTTEGLHAPLDLKQRKIQFSKQDVEKCRNRLVRKSGTLHFTCTLSLPVLSEISRLKEQISPEAFKVTYGDRPRWVKMLVAKNAREVTLETAFNSKGLDIDKINNSDFFFTYEQSAMVYFSNVLQATPLHIQVLEGRSRARP
ncbi:MAG: hypothetical protein CL677_00820 [Bdellovibrionaceae bacterium]|nr:hypothetical protein [Pseudobdellovibrionaceae bacterium]|tara:strand:+ start:30844 stop:31368 length:525 start_codon:yes stop_codon:yes gene_type:complete